MEKREKFIFNDVKMFAIKMFYICVDTVHKTLTDDENCKHALILYPKQSDFCETSKNEKDIFKVFLMRYKEDEDPDVVGLTHHKKDRTYMIDMIIGKDKEYALMVIIDYSEEDGIGTSLLVADASDEDMRLLDDGESIEDSYAAHAHTNIENALKEFSESFVFIK